jgi:hypothetical protein
MSKRAVVKPTVKKPALASSTTSTSSDSIRSSISSITETLTVIRITEEIRKVPKLLEIHYPSGKERREINLTLVELFSNFDKNVDSINIRSGSNNNINLILDFANEYAKLDEKARAKYKNIADATTAAATPPEDGLKKYQEIIKSLTISTVIDILNTAESLGFDVFIDMCCYDIAQRIKNKTSDEIRTMLNLENDLTKEDQDNLENETKMWT